MTAPVQPGEVLAGKFRVERVLGMGGMGVVVSAWHLQLDERVALKFMLPEALENQEAVARFSREARAAVKIKSEHVARVSDVGKLENGAPYMVMEFLEGEDLHHLLLRAGPLPVEQAIDYILQVCEAIAEAHSIGIVHRDLKPANLFLIKRRDGASSVKVLDFGISKGGASGSSDFDMTRTSAVMGSPMYMSPEQLESAKNCDHRADIWALGVTLYELLCCSKPFGGDTLPELVLSVMSRPPVALATRRTGVPAGLETVIQKCLEKDRNQRFQNVGQLAEALLPYAPRRSRISVERISGLMQAAGVGGAALELPPSSAPPPEAENPGTLASWGQTSPKVSRGRRAIWGIAALVVIAGGAAAFLLKPAPPAEHEGAATPAARPEATAATPRPPAANSLPVETAPAVTVTPAPPAEPTVQAEPTAAPVPAVPPRSAPGRVTPRPVKPATTSRVPAAAEPPPKVLPAEPAPRPTARPPSGTIFDDRK